jgi:hypothetical protein
MYTRVAPACRGLEELDRGSLQSPDISLLNSSIEYYTRIVLFGSLTKSRDLQKDKGGKGM